MGKLLLISLTLLFLILAHSTLVYFRSKEAAALSLAELLVPRPKTGRHASFACLLAAILTLTAAGMHPADIELVDLQRSWKIITVFAIFPMAFYFFYIKSGLQRSKGRIFFHFQSARIDWRAPILVSVLLSAFSWTFS